MNNENEQNEVTIDLVEVARLLWKNALPIVFAGLIGAALFFLISFWLVTPEYTSTTKMYVMPKTNDNVVTNQDLTAGTQLTKDYVEMATSRPVLEETITTLKLDMTPGALAKEISVSTATDTRILTIKVTDPKPKQARAIANSVRQALAEQISTVTKADSVSTVEEANLPETPSSPNLMKNTVLGALIGVLLAVAVLMVLYFMDDSVKGTEDVEKNLGLNVLSSVPDATKLNKRRGKKYA